MTILSYVSAEADLTVGYVYKWTNLVNGMMYIGSHSGYNPKYTAGGTRINYAFRKYGMEAFQREILYVGPSFFQVESEILGTINAARPDNMFYNLTNNEKWIDNPYVVSPEAVELRRQGCLEFYKTHTKKSLYDAWIDLYGIEEATTRYAEYLAKLSSSATKHERTALDKFKLSRGSHRRHHKNKGIIKTGCGWCEGRFILADELDSVVQVEGFSIQLY